MNKRTSRPFSTKLSRLAPHHLCVLPSGNRIALLGRSRTTCLIRSLLLLLLLAQAACVTPGTTRTTGVPYAPTGTPPPASAPTASQTPPASSPAPPPFALPAEGPNPDETLPTGSIWTPASVSMYQDLKARRVGDTLTITVSEKSDASKEASTKTGRYKDNSADFSFAGLAVGGQSLWKDVKTGYTGKFDNNFKGSGVTTKTDTMTAYMTATVIDILPNGNLLIRGSRWTKVNEELQQIILEGIVRPVDVNRNNEILSQRIADAKIFFVGKGPVSTQQRPGWLGQLFDIINPF
jgi:flagellar L-ring protein FlgH